MAKENTGRSLDSRKQQNVYMLRIVYYSLGIINVVLSMAISASLAQGSNQNTVVASVALVPMLIVFFIVAEKKQPPDRLHQIASAIAKQENVLSEQLIQMRAFRKYSPGLGRDVLNTTERILALLNEGRTLALYQDKNDLASYFEKRISEYQRTKADEENKLTATHD